MFSVQELTTLVEQGLSVPVIVVDSGGYPEIQDQEAARGIPPIGVQLRTPDLAALAVAMGAPRRPHHLDRRSTRLGRCRPRRRRSDLIHFDIR